MGGALCLLSVTLGGYLVWKTKRESHEAFFGLSNQGGDAFVIGEPNLDEDKEPEYLHDDLAAMYHKRTETQARTSFKAEIEAAKLEDEKKAKEESLAEQIQADQDAEWDKAREEVKGEKDK